MNMISNPQTLRLVLKLAMYLSSVIFTFYSSQGFSTNANILAATPNFYCTGNQCPKPPPGTINHEYPYAICAKEYQCTGDYVEKIIANRCGCCACHGGSTGCAGNRIVCGDGTFSQVCRCHYRLLD